MNIGNRIAELRTANGMSQQTLADLLFVSRDLVSKWENDARRPDYHAIERIAELFHVPADSILDRKELIPEELLECFQGGAALSEKELTALLNSFLRTSKARNADVFLKRYYHQMSVAEISEAYGIGENHVRSILSKTRKKLKKYVKEGHT